MNHRKHCTTTIDEIRRCLTEGLSLRQTAQRLNCSPQGLMQACSLLEELNIKNRRLQPTDRKVCAHNPFGLSAMH